MFHWSQILDPTFWELIWDRHNQIEEQEYRKMNTAGELNDFTVAELREKLKVLGLNSMGNKVDFISRLIEADSQDASGGFRNYYDESSSIM